jgi:hypothetical protein
VAPFWMMGLGALSLGLAAYGVSIVRRRSVTG